MILNLITAPTNSGYKCKPGIPLFLLDSTYSEPDAAKAAGLWWNPDARRWYTADPDKAAKLLPYATRECASHINSIITGRVQTAQLSQATDAAIDIPVPAGLAYLPFQKAGIAFLLRGLDLSKPHTYIMGIGKGATNANRSISENSRGSGEGDGMLAVGQGAYCKREGFGQTSCSGTIPSMERTGVQGNEVKNGRTGNQGEAPAGLGNGQEAARNKLEGGQWAGANRDRQEMGSNLGSCGVRQGTGCENSGANNGTQTTASVQGGLRQSNNEVRDRVGRTVPSTNCQTGQGPQENRSAGISRLDGSQNLTQLTKGGPTPSLGTLLADEMG